MQDRTIVDSPAQFEGVLDGSRQALAPAGHELGKRSAASTKIEVAKAVEGQPLDGGD
jgi:hypothetical protein